MNSLCGRLLQHCDSLAQSCPTQCNGKSACTGALGLCYQCLEKYHYKDCSSSYDCERSCYYYVGCYAHKYSVEAAIALRSLSHYRQLNVLSFGCGPSTDLLALDAMKQDKYIVDYQYTGVDHNSNWKRVHDFYMHNTVNAQFHVQDALSFLETCSFSAYNVITFQYMLSDMLKFQGQDAVYALFRALENKMRASGVFPAIIINDIKSRQVIDNLDMILREFSFYAQVKTQYFKKHQEGNNTSLDRLGFFMKKAGISGSMPKLAITEKMWKQLSSAQVILEMA